MAAVSSAMLFPVCVAMPAAIGTKATTVPTLVPIEMETKQAAMKRPGKSKAGGNAASVRLTVASMAPMLLADCAKAPAKT